MHLMKTLFLALLLAGVPAIVLADDCGSHYVPSNKIKQSEREARQALKTGMNSNEADRILIGRFKAERGESDKATAVYYLTDKGLIVESDAILTLYFDASERLQRITTCFSNTGP